MHFLSSDNRFFWLAYISHEWLLHLLIVLVNNDMLFTEVDKTTLEESQGRSKYKPYIVGMAVFVNGCDFIII